MQSLEEAALALYNNQQAQKQNQLSMLQGLENADYNKHLDRVGQYNADRNLEYNLFRDKKDAEQLAKDNKFREQQYADNLEQQSWENQFREQQHADTMSQQAWENQFNEKKYNDALSQQAWENSLKQAAAENDGEGDTGYSISDITKLVENGIIDTATAQQMLGLEVKPFEGYGGYEESPAYVSADEKLRAFAGSGNEEAMWGVLDSYISYLSEEEVAGLLKKYGLE
jgi:hypothetical protein